MEEAPAVNTKIQALKADGSLWAEFTKQDPRQPDSVKLNRRERRELIARARKAK